MLPGHDGVDVVVRRQSRGDTPGIGSIVGCRRVEEAVDAAGVIVVSQRRNPDGELVLDDGNVERALEVVVVQTAGGCLEVAAVLFEVWLVSRDRDRAGRRNQSARSSGRPAQDLDLADIVYRLEEEV